MLTRTQTLLLVVTMLATTALYATIPDPEVDPEEGTFIRGDVDDSGTVQLADAIQMLRYVFYGENEPRCLKAADANDDGMIDVSDPILVLDMLFGEAGPLAAPYPDLGVDLTEDSLPCTPLPQDRPQGSQETVYHIFDNGTVCITDPCFNWTIDDSEGENRTVSDVDVSALLLSEVMAADLLEELAAGIWLVRGHLERGPEESSGTGTTLVVAELEGFFEGGEDED